MLISNHSSLPYPSLFVSQNLDDLLAPSAVAPLLRAVVAARRRKAVGVVKEAAAMTLGLRRRLKPVDAEVVLVVVVARATVVNHLKGWRFLMQEILAAVFEAPSKETYLPSFCITDQNGTHW